MVAISGFPPAVAEELHHVIEHLEGNHADSLLFIADGASASKRWATEVEVAEVTPDELVLTLVGVHGRLEQHLAFEPTVASMEDFQVQMFIRLSAAREAMPDDPITSIERELQGRSQIGTHLVTVARVGRSGPTMAEITLVGLDDVRVLGGDEFWYLMVPKEGAEDVIDDGFSMADLETIPDDRRPDGASYTTRRRRPDDGELDMWIHLHHDTGVSGWAARAKVGDVVALWGPRVAYEPPPDTTAHLLVVDETGFPAAAAIAESLPDEHPVTIVAEVADPAHELPVAAGSAASVHWVHRNGIEPGTRPLLLERVESLGLNTAGLYAFGAAESRQISAVRRHLRNERGMAQTAVHMTGYWRRPREES